MTRIDRRRLLKVSGAGAVAASIGGMAAILAAGRAPAYGQTTSLQWLKFVDFVPVSDQLLRGKITDRFHPTRPYSAASARSGASCSARSLSMTSQLVYRLKPFSSKNRTAPVQINRYVVSSSAVVASCRMPDGS
jgi:hypothetical protein